MAIVFFDFDGTLVDETQGICSPTQATLDSIRQLQENGHYAVLATGRAKSYVPDMGIKWDGIIASNGAYAEIEEEVVYNKLMPKETIEKVIDYSKDLGFIYVLENQDFCYTNGYNNSEFMDKLKFFNVDTENFRSVDEAKEICANKMFLTCDNEEMFKKMQKELEGSVVLGLHRGGVSCDCDTPGMNKGIGIAQIAASADVSIDDTYAFGDGINDYDIINNVGHGIAMGIHRHELEEVCEMITDTVKGEGITKALKKYGLI